MYTPGARVNPFVLVPGDPEERTPMGLVENRQGIIDLRDQAFRLAELLSREANRSGAAPGALEAATELQSVAFLLGEAERHLAEPAIGPRFGPLRLVKDGLTAA
jgi:hypothetical protein